MVEPGTISEINKISIRLSAAFAIIGIGLMYLYIVVTDASMPTKVLWSSALSLAVAFTFLVVWSIARDSLRQREREVNRVRSP
jgi:energy-coupling factor transporter transmembrane protein EcfT